LIRSQFLSLKDLPPDNPTPNVCIPADAPAKQTSDPEFVTDGADAVGGADLMFDVELFVVVVLFELPL
jgi:hypothetical protein